MTWIEIFGYCGSVLVGTSLMMKSIKKLRYINLLGASIFSTYGFLVGAYPVFILNGVITLVDIYYIYQMSREKDYFTVLPILPTSKYMSKFIEFYEEDIKKFFPSLKPAILVQNENVFILRNMIPAGLISFHIEDGSTAIIDLDYAIPDYRDLKNAFFILSCESSFFLDRGVKSLVAFGEAVEHKKYLLKIGFSEVPSQPFRMMKQLCK